MSVAYRRTSNPTYFLSELTMRQRPSWLKVSPQLHLFHSFIDHRLVMPFPHHTSLHTLALPCLWWPWIVPFPSAFHNMYGVLCHRCSPSRPAAPASPCLARCFLICDSDFFHLFLLFSFFFAYLSPFFFFFLRVFSYFFAYPVPSLFFSICFFSFCLSEFLFLCPFFASSRSLSHVCFILSFLSLSLLVLPFISSSFHFLSPYRSTSLISSFLFSPPYRSPSLI